ncbi:MarR family winged helix-turn-helix transcriptional regulator [Bacteriovorax sp. Seq25_V]|uniref:MarR family winged helix-turn-helix transcriptional regulator n=1 Tax=Bacteriovorax sp. Seq25_V TaxID=1201288 RepID=UPI00038A15AB|nr:MarR family winged helix-turn-helix transcriptional regulator [Bacteriovorax sp. Seq25_V]EQC43439.1 MarR family protein [Bacteriovorax sp. Seq25_V]
MQRKEIKLHELDLDILAANIRTTKLFDDLITKGIAQYGISKPQFDIMVFIYFGEEKKTTVTEIAINNSVSKANVTGIMNRMITQGLIQSVVDQKDARVKNVTLTEKGEELMKTTVPVYQDLIRKTLSPFSHAEKELLLKQLKHIEGCIREKL